jgi:AAA family ATP:ADP antiporter
VSLFGKVRAINSVYLGLEKKERLDLVRLGLTLFLLFFSYPLMRSTTTSLLLTSLGVKASPYAWIFSTIGLSISVTLLNKFQKKIRPQILYALITIITIIFFSSFFLLFKNINIYWAYPLYVLKEIYIVLMVHSVLAHLNSSITEKVAKVVYGPLGALGSSGGILGGLITSSLVKGWGEESLFFIGLIIIALTIPCFFYTSKGQAHLTEAKEENPLQSIKGIKAFVFLIAGIVLLSQFVINIGNYQFNIYLNDTFTDSISKTEYLGKIYAVINSFSLVAQVILLPFLLKFVPQFITHLGIPVVYGVTFFFGWLLFGDGMMPMAVTFIIFKGLDYSLFGAAKELLYYALNDIQKYGAKYVADMITYRLAKGIISIILIKIPGSLISSLLGVCLMAWILCLFPLIKLYKKHHETLEVN